MAVMLFSHGYTAIEIKGLSVIIMHNKFIFIYSLVNALKKKLKCDWKKSFYYYFFFEEEEVCTSINGNIIFEINFSRYGKTLIKLLTYY